MRFTGLLYNPTFGVYNLRFLILAALALISYTTASLWAAEWNPNTIFPLVTGFLILVHHISALFVGKPPVVAIDLLLTILEIILTGVSSGVWVGQYGTAILIPLIAAGVFRTASLRASSDGFWRQKFVFLGGCSHETTSQLSQLRGELLGIIVLRALILSGIVLAIPIFAVYSIILIPLQAPVQLIEFPNGFPDGFGSPGELQSIDVLKSPLESGAGQDMTIAIYVPKPFGPNNFTYSVAVSDVGGYPETSSFMCSHLTCVISIDGFVNLQTSIAECSPLSWSAGLTFSLTFTARNTPPLVHVVPGQGDITYILTFTEPIPVLLGSHLFAYI
ncbi:hypothetical protein B0H19DRAFT_1269049 [Mycena capillaripes]|nr:hypothetical protein B0H19DRAFT_1269049 [Mycena capillaripes]